MSLVRDYVLQTLWRSTSVTATITNRSGIGYTVIETDHIGVTPHSDTKLNNACTTMIFLTSTTVDRRNFFVMNISLLLGTSIP